MIYHAVENTMTLSQVIDSYRDSINSYQRFGFGFGFGCGFSSSHSGAMTYVAQYMMQASLLQRNLRTPFVF